MLKKRSLRAVSLVLIVVTILSGAEALMVSDYAYAAKKEGPVKYKGKLYFFKKGRPAKAKKERMRSYKGAKYYVLKSGRIKKGWNVVKNDLYYFGGKKGAMVKGKRVKGITLLLNGKAQKSYKNKKGKKIKALDVSIRIKCIKALKKRGAWNKSKSRKLRAAWKYLMTKKFRYKSKYPNLKDKQWTKKYADYMLSKHRGNCYGYAATFAAFAWVAGYDPYVICGRCRGGRDNSRDGYTRHSLVRINGKWYDPEYWAIWHAQYHYGAKKLRYRLKDRKKPIRFKKVKGTVKSTIQTISGNLKKIDGKYYYLNSKGTPVKGVFYIKGKLYHFKTKSKNGWCMTAKDYNKYQNAAKKGAPYSELKALIGTTEKTSDECMEDAVTYIYKNVYVTTQVNSNGVEAIYEVGDAKDLQL